MAAASEDFQARNTRLLIVGPGTRQHAQRFVDAIHAGTTPVLYDQAGKVYDVYMLDSVFFSLIQKSAVFVIDLEGVIRYAYVTSNVMNWRGERLPELLGILDSL